MTNEELAELERRIVAGYEGGEKTDDGSQSWGLGFEAGVRAALIATAREAEALRAENARLTERINRFDNAASLFYQLRTTIMVRFDGLKSTDSALWRSINAAFDKLEAARAALEQGEVK